MLKMILSKVVQEIIMITELSKIAFLFQLLNIELLIL